MTPTLTRVLAAAASTAAHPGRFNVLGLIPLALLIGAVVLARNLSQRYRRSVRSRQDRPRLPETGGPQPPAAPADGQPGGGRGPQDPPGGPAS